MFLVLPPSLSTERVVLKMQWFAKLGPDGLSGLAKSRGVEEQLNWAWSIRANWPLPESSGGTALSPTANVQLSRVMYPSRGLSLPFHLYIKASNLGQCTTFTHTSQRRRSSLLRAKLYTAEQNEIATVTTAETVPSEYILKDVNNETKIKTGTVNDKNKKES